MSSEISRRSFLKQGAAAAIGLAVVPSTVLGKKYGHVSPSDKLNIAAVGIGGMGHANINHVKKTENIVALCDVDWKYAKGVFDHHGRCHDHGQARVLPEAVDALGI